MKAINRALVVMMGACASLTGGLQGQVTKSVVAWGDNSRGQCNEPTPNIGFVALSAGGSHSLGLKSDGSVVAWGDISYGQCNVPAPNSGFVAVDAGGVHSLGLKADGSIVAWGGRWGGPRDHT